MCNSPRVYLHDSREVRYLRLSFSGSWLVVDGLVGEGPHGSVGQRDPGHVLRHE
jgi:hypothetical protein